MPEDEDPRRDEDYRILRNAVASIIEHFDTVQVVATRVEDDSTFIRVAGDGNIYARVESCRVWVKANS